MAMRAVGRDTWQLTQKLSLFVCVWQSASTRPSLTQPLSGMIRPGATGTANILCSAIGATQRPELIEEDQPFPRVALVTALTPLRGGCDNRASRGPATPSNVPGALKRPSRTPVPSFWSSGPRKMSETRDFEQLTGDPPLRPSVGGREWSLALGR